MKSKVLLLTILVSIFPQANALVDLRVGYGLNNGNPSQFNSAMDSLNPGYPAAKSMTGFNLDAILSLPLVPFGFGIRYESLSASANQNFAASSAALASKFTFDRLALLVNYHIIDTLVYFGPLATYGITNTSKLNIDCDLCSPATHIASQASSVTTYSVGVEGGLKLLLLRVGAELGYASFTGKDYAYNGANFSSAGSNVKIEMNGLYAKVLLGIGI